MKAVIAAVIAWAAVLACPHFALAIGTASGTSIAADATMTAGNAATATAIGPATSVVSVYGITTNSQPSDSITTTAGTVYYKLKFTNNANTSDSIRIVTGQQTFGAGAGTTTAWAVEVDDADPYVTGLTWTNSGTVKASQSGDYTSMTVGADTSATFTLKITSASNAADGSTMSVPISLQTIQTAGAYTGYNGLSYGGVALSLRTAGVLSTEKLTTTIQGAVLTLVKTYAVQSPTSYQSLGGNSASPVPGSKVTYTITYSNSGLVAAGNVTIIDPLPSGTTFVTGSIKKNGVDAGSSCNYNTSNAGAVTCNIGTVPALSGNLTIQYSVTID